MGHASMLARVCSRLGGGIGMQKDKDLPLGKMSTVLRRRLFGAGLLDNDPWGLMEVGLLDV